MKYIFIFILLIYGLTGNCQRVYKTPYGKKYHLSTCRMVENVSKDLSIADAFQLGLTPCKICKPPALDNSLQLGSNTTRGERNTVRCKGITKKGTRCKHMTSIGNSYCFQHNPDK